MSILEAKRAQGFLDTDVLVGTTAKGFRIVGNSVCRQVAFVLGGKFAEAVRKGPVGSGEGSVAPEDMPVRWELVGARSRAPSRQNFMVLIEQKKRNDESVHWCSDVNIPSEDMRVVGQGRHRVEVSVVASPRKRIRIDDEAL